MFDTLAVLNNHGIVLYVNAVTENSKTTSRTVHRVIDSPAIITECSHRCSRWATNNGSLA